MLELEGPGAVLLVHQMWAATVWVVAGQLTYALAVPANGA